MMVKISFAPITKKRTLKLSFKAFSNLNKNKTRVEKRECFREEGEFCIYNAIKRYSKKYVQNMVVFIIF